MLDSKLQFFLSVMTFFLFVTILILSIQEAEFYVGSEDLWKKESWTLLKK